MEPRSAGLVSPITNLLPGEEVRYPREFEEENELAGLSERSVRGTAKKPCKVA